MVIGSNDYVNYYMKKIILILSLFIFACDEEPDCAGVSGGSAVMDDCGICDSDPTNDGAFCNDCRGIPNGGYSEDPCGYCGLPGGEGWNECIDCAGNPFGLAVRDECNVCCGGLTNVSCGLEPGICDCDGNVEDCAGVCGGDAVLSGCDNVCNSTAVEDCAGVCGGDAVDLGCGCGEAGPSGCDNVCGSTAVEDCNGDCGGSAVEDECGVCGGSGIADGACDCDGNVLDCTGVCGGIEDCLADNWYEYGEGGYVLSSGNTVPWNAASYQNTNSVTYAVQLDGEMVGDEGDLLGAFYDGDLRGIADTFEVTFGDNVGENFFLLYMYSNSSGSESFSFKFYDASEDTVLDIAETYLFVADDPQGDLFNPELLNIATDVEISFDVSAGWNWISFNVQNEDMSTNNVLGSIGSYGDYVKTQGGFADHYGEGNGWYGTLQFISIEELIKLNVASSGTVDFSGSPVTPSDHPIDLEAGWNWIGYLPSASMGINNAIGGIGAFGDYIKGQGGFADHYGEGNGWYGTLQLLNPFEGYMVNLAEGGTLVYPDGAGLARVVSNNDEINLLDFNYHDYEFNGSITSEINIDDIIISESDLLISYSEDGQCRGYASPLLFPLTNKYIFPLMIYSNNNQESDITFEYYNAISDTYYTLNNNINFESDMIIGNGLTPHIFEDESSEIISGLSVKSAYPNPFNPSTNIEYSISQSGNVKISIYDVTGRQVDVLHNEYQSNGSHSVVWNAINSPSGIYYIQIQAQSDVYTQKVVLLK